MYYGHVTKAGNVTVTVTVTATAPAGGRAASRPVMVAGDDGVLLAKIGSMKGEPSDKLDVLRFEAVLAECRTLGPLAIRQFFKS